MSLVWHFKVSGLTMGMDRESGPLRGGDGTTVTIGLLHVILGGLDTDLRVLEHLTILLYGA